MSQAFIFSRSNSICHVYDLHKQSFVAFILVNEHSGGCIGITGYSYLTRKFCNVNLLSVHNTVSRKNSLSLNKCMLCKSTKIMREMKYTAVAQ